MDTPGTICQLWLAASTSLEHRAISERKSPTVPKESYQNFHADRKIASGPSLIGAVSARSGHGPMNSLVHIAQIAAQIAGFESARRRRGLLGGIRGNSPFPSYLVFFFGGRINSMES